MPQRQGSGSKFADFIGKIKESNKKLLVGVCMAFAVLVLSMIIILVRVGKIPEEVRVSNKSSNTVTISWVTEKPTVGEVEFSVNEDLSGESVAYDERGNDKYYTHMVVLRNLEPETTYYFSLPKSSSEEYAFTTTKVAEEMREPKPFYGRVVDSDGNGIANALVYAVAIKAEDELKSQLLSTFTGENGSWAMDRTNFLDENGEYFGDIGESDGVKLYVYSPENSDQVFTTSSGGDKLTPFPKLILAEADSGGEMAVRIDTSKYLAQDVLGESCEELDQCSRTLQACRDEVARAQDECGWYKDHADGAPLDKCGWEGDIQSRENECQTIESKCQGISCTYEKAMEEQLGDENVGDVDAHVEEAGAAEDIGAVSCAPGQDLVLGGDGLSYSCVAHEGPENTEAVTGEVVEENAVPAETRAEIMFQEPSTDDSATRVEAEAAVTTAVTYALANNDGMIDTPVEEATVYQVSYFGPESLDEGYNTAKENAENAWDTTVETVQSVPEDVSNKAEDTWNYAKGQTEKAWNDATGYAEEAWDYTKERASTMYDSGVNLYKEAKRSVQNVTNIRKEETARGLGQYAAAAVMESAKLSKINNLLTEKGLENKVDKPSSGGNVAGVGDRVLGVETQEIDVIQPSELGYICVGDQVWVNNQPYYNTVGTCYGSPEEANRVTNRYLKLLGEQKISGSTAQVGDQDLEDVSQKYSKIYGEDGPDRMYQDIYDLTVSEYAVCDVCAPVAIPYPGTQNQQANVLGEEEEGDILASGINIVEAGTYEVGGIKYDFRDMVDGKAAVPILIFEDTNGNGSLDEGEEVLEDAQIALNQEAETFSFDLLEGWNSISFQGVPVKAGGEPMMASDLVEIISFEGGYVSTVETYDGRWTAYNQRQGEQFSGEDFEIVPGRGYFLKSETISSFSVSVKRNVESAPIQLNNGWSLIGLSPGTETEWSHSEFNDGVGAFEFIGATTADGIESDTVVRWDSGNYKSVVRTADSDGELVDYGLDFTMIPGQAYFVQAKKKDVFWP